MKTHFLYILFFSVLAWGSTNFFDNLTLSGNIVTTGTVDGRDVSTDGGTLDALNTNALLSANNLSDVASAPTSRTNLGLGDSATRNVGTSAGTVTAGDDSRIGDAVEIQNRAVAATLPTNGQALVFNTGAGQWEPQTQAGGGGFTEGSVIFADSLGAITEDNVGLFFDPATNRLGIGDNTPDAILDVEAAALTVDFIDTSGSGSGPVVTIGGVTDAPTTIQLGDASDRTALQIRTDTSSTNETLIFDSGGDTTLQLFSNDAALFQGPVGVNGTSASASVPLDVGSAPIVRFLNTGDQMVRMTSGDSFDSILAMGDGTDPDIGRIVYQNTDQMELYTNNTLRQFIDSAGAVTFQKIAAAGDSLDVTIKSGTTGTSRICMADTDASCIGAVRYSHSANSLTIDVNGSGQMFIDSSGRFGFGSSSGTIFSRTTNNADELTAFISNEDTTLTTTLLALSAAGDTDASGINLFTISDQNTTLGRFQALTATTGDFISTSDARLKENILAMSLELAIERIKKLTVRTWDWIGGESDYGWVAQDIMENLPDAQIAFGDPNGNEKINPVGINKNQIIPLNTAGIQWLVKENEIRKEENAVRTRNQQLICTALGIVCETVKPIVPVLVAVEIDDLSKPLTEEIAGTRITLEIAEGKTARNTVIEHLAKLKSEGSITNEIPRFEKSLFGGSVDVWFVTPTGFEKKTVMR